MTIQSVAITMAHERIFATRNTPACIQQYIFPGGLSPSAETSLRPRRERLLQRRDELARLGIDEVFERRGSR